MNKGILLNYNLLCNYDKLKVVNWSLDKINYWTKIEKKIKNKYILIL